MLSKLHRQWTKNFLYSSRLCSFPYFVHFFPFYLRSESSPSLLLFIFLTFDLHFSYSFSSSFCCICQIFYWKVWIELWRNSRKSVTGSPKHQINSRVPLLCSQHIDWFLYSWKLDIIAPFKLKMKSFFCLEGAMYYSTFQ